MKLLDCSVGRLAACGVFAVTVIVLASCTAKPLDAITYRSSDGTHIHVPAGGGRFYFTSNAKPNFEGDTGDLAGDFQVCSNEEFACASLQGIVLAVPKGELGPSWTYLGFDFRRDASTDDLGTITVEATSSGEKYAGFTFRPRQGIVSLDLGVYGTEEFREYRLLSDKGLLAPGSR